MKFDLQKMTTSELRELRDAVDKALQSAIVRDRREAKKAAARAVAEFGLTLDDISENAPKRRGRPPKGDRPARAKSKARAKYRNPDDATQTWTGRGRRPEWIKSALQSGVDISKLEI